MSGMCPFFVFVDGEVAVYGRLETAQIDELFRAGIVFEILHRSRQSLDLPCRLTTQGFGDVNSRGGNLRPEHFPTVAPPNNILVVVLLVMRGRAGRLWRGAAQTCKCGEKKERF